MSRPLPALLSIHDVMPDTLPRVAEILALLRIHKITTCTLLVVPGKGWQPDQLRQLRQWADEGWSLAAHGWHHRARHIRGLYHRLHAAVLSRDVAEHLALSPAQRIDLITESHAWFRCVDLPAPSLYVPPAWALGRLPADRLPNLPFRCLESLSGLHFPASGLQHRLPLTGYEADTPARAAFLRFFNATQFKLARLTRRSLRISIHPHDLHLHLATQLRHHLARPIQPRPYPIQLTP